MSNEEDQAERRRILREDRAASTYHQFAEADANEHGGRFAKEMEARVTGVPQVPPMPEGNPWAEDIVPAEGPLGYSVNEMEPVGNYHEVSASLTGLMAPTGSPSPVVETDAPSRPSAERDDE
jgi:hypothetical protein